MKKLLLLLILSLFIFSANAQWSAGARAGVNFSTINGKWDENDETKTAWITGPLIGGIANYKFTDMFSLSAEFNYLWMGEVYKYTSLEGRGITEVIETEKHIYNTIQMAILARAMFGNGLITPFFMFGPFISGKLGGRVIVNGPYGRFIYNVLWQAPPASRGSDGDWYVDPAYNRRWDFGLYLSGGAGTDLGPGRLEFDFRFGFGLLDLNKFDSKEAKQNQKDQGYKPYRSMNIALTLAYMIKFKEK